MKKQEIYSNQFKKDFEKVFSKLLKTKYNLVAKTLQAIKVSNRPDMYNNLSKQEVINMCNSMSYYKRLDNNIPEITTFEEAKKTIELTGDWKVVKCLISK